MRTLLASSEKFKVFKAKPESRNDFHTKAQKRQDVFLVFVVLNS